MTIKLIDYDCGTCCAWKVCYLPIIVSSMLPYDQLFPLKLSTWTHGPRTNCPPGLLVLGPAVLLEHLVLEPHVPLKTSCPHHYADVIKHTSALQAEQDVATVLLQLKLNLSHEFWERKLYIALLSYFILRHKSVSVASGEHKLQPSISSFGNPGRLYPYRASPAHHIRPDENPPTSFSLDFPHMSCQDQLIIPPLLCCNR